MFIVSPRLYTREPKEKKISFLIQTENNPQILFIQTESESLPFTNKIVQGECIAIYKILL